MNCYPLEITNLDSETAKELMNLFTGELSGYIRVGPKGYLYPDIFKNEANNIYTLPLRSTDIFVVSFPRSGTTLTQELVWMIANDLDYDKSYATRLTKRYWFLDSRILNHPKVIDSIKIQVEGNKEKMELLEMFTQQGVMRLHDMPSPRFIKTHFPLSLLPPALLDNVKTVYVARDPRDAVVSYYHHNKRLRNKGYTGDFKTFWNYFIKDLLIRAPFFEHVKEAWSKRHHPNMLFLFYEELVMDMPTCIHRVATFLNKQIANDQIVRLCEHLQFDNFKNNKSVSEDMAQIPELINLDEEPFIRRGKVGGWRDYFDADMTKQAEQWIADNLRDTDLRFSEI